MLDYDDECQSTPLGQIVDTNGCSIEQLCEDAAKNHGAYVSCVAHTAMDFLKAELISKDEKKDIVIEAAKSDVGKKNKPAKRKK